jgi:predicted SAM-dependent methyltransferase/polysaccharide pyruvyl transferase WcaK-like protein
MFFDVHEMTAHMLDIIGKREMQYGCNYHSEAVVAKYLNLGPGSVWKKPGPEWLTVDADPKNADVCADLNRTPSLPFDDEAFCSIYASHFFEHISLFSVQPLLHDCFRVLKNNGVLRIVIPDVARSIQEFLRANHEFDLFKRRRTRNPDYTFFECLREDFLSPSLQKDVFGEQALAHQNAFDYETLEKYLKKAGFSFVYKSSFGKSARPEFAWETEQPGGEWAQVERSLYIEGVKERMPQINRGVYEGQTGKRRIWHVGAWAGNFGDSIIQRSLTENLKVASGYELEFKYINCQTTEFTEELIAEMNEEADLLLLGGGGLVFFRPQDKSKSGWQFNIDIDLLDKIQVPLVVHAIGYNKFEYDRNDFPSITNKHLQKTVEKAALFSVRNTGTRDELIRRGCNGPKIQVIPDSGMFLNAEFTPVPGLRPDKFKIGINWTSDREDQTFPEPWEENKQQFIRNLLGLCRYLIRERNAQIVYVGHMGNGFDSRIITALKTLGEHLLVADEILPSLYPGDYDKAKNLPGVYKQMDLVLGMRGHANIVSFGQHVPLISLGSHRKNRYFLEDIGESNYGIDARDPSKSTEAAMIRTVCALLDEQDTYLQRHRQTYQRLYNVFTAFNDSIIKLLHKNFEQCPICGGSPEFYRRTNRYEIYRDVVICKTCELIYLSPLVRDSEHDSLYNETYWRLYESPSVPDEAYHQHRAVTSLYRIDFIEKSCILTKDSAFLDIGCGGGTFLMHLKNKGYSHLSGVEIDPNYSHYVETEIGATVLRQNIECVKSDRQYDIITMWHVLEHMSDLDKGLAAVKKLIKNDGKLFIEVPMIFDVAKPPQNKVSFQIAHNYYFTRKSLDLVLRRAGFNTIQSEITPRNVYIACCQKTKKILITTYFQRHLKKMLPIIKELEKRPDVQLTVMLHTSEEWELAEKEGIRYSKFDDYTTKKRRNNLDLEWGLEPLIYAIKVEKPDLFLAIEVNYILRNAVHYCKQKGIRTLIVQHGTPNKYSLHAFAPFEADCFAAWGDFTKDFLVKNGVEPKRLVVTGGPCFDVTFSLNPDKKKICADVGIDPKKKIIVFTTQASGAGGSPTQEEIEAGIRETCHAASRYPDLQLLFQVSPNQSIESIQRIVDATGPSNAVAVRYKDTESLMAISDGVITFFSTTAIDALLLGKPLFLINLSDDRDFYPFVPMAAAFGAYTKAEIQPAFKKLVEQPEELNDGREQAVPYVVYKTDGKSLQRVMALIEALS